MQPSTKGQTDIGNGQPIEIKDINNVAVMGEGDSGSDSDQKDSIYADENVENKRIKLEPLTDDAGHIDQKVQQVSSALKK